MSYTPGRLKYSGTGGYSNQLARFWQPGTLDGTVDPSIPNLPLVNAPFFPDTTYHTYNSGTSDAATWEVTTGLVVPAKSMAIAFVTTDGWPYLWPGNRFWLANSDWVSICEPYFQTSEAVAQAIFVCYNDSDAPVTKTLEVYFGQNNQATCVIAVVEPSATGKRLHVDRAFTYGDSTNSNPPSLTPRGGTQNYRWFVSRGGDAQVIATDPPTSFEKLITAIAPGASSASTNVAERDYTGSTLDPGTFTAATEQWVTTTVAVWETDEVDFHPVNVGSNSYFGTANSYFFTDFAPADDDLILAIISSHTTTTATPNTPTMTGFGLTWTQVVTNLFDDDTADRRRVTVFKASGTVSTDRIDIDFGGQNQSNIAYSVLQFPGYADVAQYDTDASLSISAGGTWTSTLASAPSGPTLGIAAYGGFSFGRPDNGWDYLTDTGWVYWDDSIKTYFNPSGDQDFALEFDATWDWGTLGLINLELEPTSSGGTGSVSATLENATLSSAAQLQIKGTVAATLANATLAATGTVEIRGTSAVTLADATLASGGTVQIRGQASVTLADVTLAAAGALQVKGTVTATLADATLSAAGAVQIRGTSAVTLADATLASAGTVQIKGQASITLGDATLSATGALADTGAASVTLANATLAATGALDIKASLAVTLADATLSATSTIVSGISGTAAVTLADATLAATGTVQIRGQASITLADATLSATGALADTGAASVTLANATLAATGALQIRGALGATLADATLSSTGAVQIAGASGGTLANATLAATATLQIRGALGVTLGDATLSATGELGGTATGTVGVTLANATLSATGALRIAGELAATLQDATLAATATVPALRVTATARVLFGRNGRAADADVDRDLAGRAGRGGTSSGDRGLFGRFLRSWRAE